MRALGVTRHLAENGKVPKQRLTLRNDTLYLGVRRALAVVLMPLLVLTSVPVSAAPGSPRSATYAAPPSTTDSSMAPPAPQVTVNKTPPKVEPVPLRPVFSDPPKDEEFFRARVFGEPFVPIGGPTSVEENRAFARALLAFHAAGDNEEVTALGLFLNDHPRTAWRASLVANLGSHYSRTGYYSRALATLTEAWNLAKGAPEPLARAIADHALGELLDLHGKFGQVEKLEGLIAESKDRDLHGDAVEKASNARRAIYILREKHEEAFASGAVAVDRYLGHGKPGYTQHPEIAQFHATPQGASLADIQALTARTGIGMEMAFRGPGGNDLVVPSIVHLKQGHFAALVKEENGRYVLADPILGGEEVWLSRSALLEEASGYFLVPVGLVPQGWSKPTAAEVGNVRGKCVAAVYDPRATFCSVGGAGGNGGGSGGSGGGSSCGPNGCGMATYSFNRGLASLQISDSPVGHSPPRGPAVEFRVSYDQREAYQPAVFTFSNLGPRWSHAWLSYVEDDPSNPSGPVYAFLRGGGSEVHSGLVGISYPPHLLSRAVVVRTSSSPITYERRLPDGSVEAFSQSDGAVSPRRVFLSQLRDPQGNSLSLTYDSQLRIVAVTDALGQVTTLSYGLLSDPLKVTKVTDPFGRSAKLEYDASGALLRITDVIGIVSEMEYGNGDFIRALTTPYGTTTFSYATPQGEPGVYYPDRWVEAIDPLGGKERIEYRWGTAALPASDPPNTVPTAFINNVNLNARNTFYWDKRAMALYPGDFTKAQAWHWLWSSSMMVTPILHSEKKPLEGRIWYGQRGESFAEQAGPDGKAAKVGRVLDDGTSQIWRYEYESQTGKVMRQTDPLGRTTTYTYAPNGIDLLEVRQVNGQNTELLQSFTYNTQHRPLTVTDAAGQTTTYTYNAAGQVLTVTTPPRAGITENRTTTFTYDTNGYLQSALGPAAGATVGLTYDGYGRVRTWTDQSGHTLTYDYDALDRTTKITHPDGTYEETVYNRLDPEKQRDRLGRWSQTFYDALRRPVAMRDPLGRTTTQQWCSCGSLDKVIDGNNNATTWERDLQGRITKETRADASFTQFVYENTTSRLKQRIDRKNQTTTYSYFLDDSLQQTVYTNAQNPTPTVSYTYDPVYPRKATMTDGTGTTTWSYNPITTTPSLGAGLLASASGPVGSSTYTTTFAYDELTRVTSRSVDGAAATASYDALGRVSSETDPLGAVSYTYVGATSRLSSVSLPNGQTTSFLYFDSLGDNRLQEIKHLDPGAAILSKFNYTYDAAGNIKTWSQQAGTNPAKLYAFDYDGARQLTRAVISGVTPLPVPSRFGYGYDNAGNRTAEQLDDAVTGATYDNMNHLVSTQAGGTLAFRGSVNELATVTVGGKPAQVAGDNSFQGTATVPSGTSNVVVAATDPSGNVRTNAYQLSQSGTPKALSYDLDGNLTNDETRSYEWDAENRLTAVNQGMNRSEFTYDGHGRRVRIVEKVNGTPTSDKRYVWCGIKPCQERDASGATVTKAFYRHGIMDGSIKLLHDRGSPG